MRSRPFSYNPDIQRSAVFLLAVGLFGYVFLQTAWIGDDAFITFRTIENFLNGYGPVWNIDERVQAYSHPLWLLLLTVGNIFTGELYFTTIIISFLLSLLAVLLLLNRFADHLPKALFLLLVLVSSKAFVDYTSSGLENPLAYLLVALFYPWYMAANWTEGPMKRPVLLSSLVISAAYLTRPDLPLLFVAPWLHILARAIQEKTRGVIGNTILGLTPIFLWTVFSVVYYGFIFPNTYYAKINPEIPFITLLANGLRYVWVSLLFDPVTLIVIALACVLSLTWKRRIEIITANISVLLYLVYIVSIGGDFMSGRFFGVPFLIASFLLADNLNIEKRIWWSAPLLVVIVYNVAMPLVPMKSKDTPGWNHAQYYGIADERGSYAKYLSLRSVWKNNGVITHYWAEHGRRLKQSAPPGKVVFVNSVGLRGYFGGNTLIIGFYGLVDPLLARLPVLPYQKRLFRPGHLIKAVPVGYLESRGSDRNQISDERVRKYYDKIKLVTRGDLFSAKRWRAILDMNLGPDRRFNGTYPGLIPVLKPPKKSVN